jgi:hypothetical protein
MATEPLQAAPYPVGTDAPDGPTQIQNLAVWAARRINMIFASAAARTSAFSAAGVSAAEGMQSYRTDDDVWEEWTGSAWVPLVEGGPWTSLSLPSGYTAVGAPYGVPQYRKVRNRVLFRGAVNVATSNAAGTKFTLPAGFRPASLTQACYAMMSNGTAVSGHLRYDVGTSGNMVTLTASPAATTFVSFEQMSFSLD